MWNIAAEENTPQNFREFFPNNVPEDLLKHMKLIFSTLKIWTANVQVIYFAMYFWQNSGIREEKI